MVQTYSKIPLYRTSARVMIQDERTGPSATSTRTTDFWQDPTYYNTQYSILRSRGLAKRVVSGFSCRIIRSSTAPRRSRGPLTTVREARRKIGTAVRISSPGPVPEIDPRPG